MIELIFKVLAYCYLVIYMFTIYGTLVIYKNEKKIETLHKWTLAERSAGALLSIGIILILW